VETNFLNLKLLDDMNKLERMYNEVQVHGGIGKTSLICSNLFVKTNPDLHVFISFNPLHDTI
jgi:hypothetical protein